MSNTVIIVPEDESFVIVASEIPSLIVHSEAESRVVQAVALATMIYADEPNTEVIEATGSGSLSGNYFRGLINYDGGHADTDYADLIHLDGGGADDGRRYSI